jgi:hypothetical protein
MSIYFIKDALLVEISILEEKLESTIKVLNNQHTQKVKLMSSIARLTTNISKARLLKIETLEKSHHDHETSLVNKYKAEISDLKSAHRAETEAVEQKYKHELENKSVAFNEKEMASARK